MVKEISLKSFEYPYLLKKIPDPPKSLYCIGNMDLLKKKCVTIVGTRECTKYGEKIVNMLLQEDLLGLGYVFVSGLAKGIDSIVHKRCLELGLETIAVVAGGIDVGYPRCNQEIYDEICKKGLVVSEYAEGYIPAKYMFPRRNRIMVGLSQSVIIVESHIKGGSVVTAQLALDSNRNVHAVPGNICNKSSQGCNLLIQSGAYPILKREDFLEILGIENEQINMRAFM